VSARNPLSEIVGRPFGFGELTVPYTSYLAYAVVQ
jgi:hypothetical protein